MVASNGRGGSPLAACTGMSAKPRDPTGGSAACGSLLPPARECPRATPSLGWTSGCSRPGALSGGGTFRYGMVMRKEICYTSSLRFDVARMEKKQTNRIERCRGTLKVPRIGARRTCRDAFRGVLRLPCAVKKCCSVRFERPLFRVQKRRRSGQGTGLFRWTETNEFEKTSLARSDMTRCS